MILETRRLWCVAGKSRSSGSFDRETQELSSTPKALIDCW